MNTLKQLQETGDAEFIELIDKSWDMYGERYEVYNPDSFTNEIKTFLHQQTTLVFEAGKAEVIAEVQNWLKKRCEANARLLGTHKWNSDMEDLIEYLQTKE